MNTLHPSPVSSDRFTYTNGIFVADASDLPALGRVYADACDEGLTIVSAHTGRSVVFAVTREVRDSEGELVYTVLVPADPIPGVALLVWIFND